MSGVTDDVSLLSTDPCTLPTPSVRFQSGFIHKDATDPDNVSGLTEDVSGLTEDM